MHTQILGTFFACVGRAAPDDPVALTMANLAVEPAGRRKGIGRALMTAALDIGSAHGAEWCVISVMRDNAGAIELYDGMGFVPSHYVANEVVSL